MFPSRIHRRIFAGPRTDCGLRAEQHQSRSPSLHASCSLSLSHNYPRLRSQEKSCALASPSQTTHPSRPAREPRKRVAAQTTTPGLHHDALSSFTSRNTAQVSTESSHIQLRAKRETTTQNTRRELLHSYKNPNWRTSTASETAINSLLPGPTRSQPMISG